MSSFYARNLARYFAASQMERMSRPATPQTPDYVAEGVSAWNKNMLWLIPFVQASGYRVHSGTDPTVHFSGVADNAEADASQTAYLPDASTKVFQLTDNLVARFLVIMLDG